MSGIEAGLIGFAVIIILVLLGVNVAFALIMAGFSGLIAIIGIDPALASLATVPFERATSYDLAVLPLFLLMSAFVSGASIGKEAYEMAHAWLGQLRGGLAIATTGACGIFAACCGSSLASAVAMGKVAYPEMKRYNYDDRLSVGTIAAGGTLGILIPPSLGFILIGILTGISIGKLFISGIIPGIIQMLFYIGTIYILCRINPSLGPALPKTTLKQKFVSIKLTWPIVGLFLLIMGGLYGGVFTPTEAGGIGAAGALAISLVRRQITGSKFAWCLLDTAKMSSMIIALIVGAFIFNQFLAITRVPNIASEYIVGMGLNKYLVLFLIIILYIILGMIFDIQSICVVTVPIIFPIMTSIGFDPIWYGVIMVRLMEIGLISPPFAMNLFALAGVVDVPLSTMYRGIIPFLIADAFNLVLLIAIPSLSTFLPNMMMKTG